MRGIAMVVLCLTSAACGAFRPKPTERPTELTEGETAYLIRGDFDAAAKYFQSQLEASPSTTAAFLLGDLQDAIGRPEEALENYFTALTIARDVNDDAASAVASAMAVIAIRDRVERFFEKFERFMQSIHQSPGKLPPEAWFQLLNLRFSLFRMRGKQEEARAELSKLGCPTRWKTAGPMGPWIWSTFDSESNVPDRSSGPKKINLGPGRGSSAVRDVKGDSCFIIADNPSMPLGGVTWARTTAVLAHAGAVRLRLQTAYAASVRVGGQEVLRRDPRNAFLSKVLWVSVDLPAGATDIVVKLAGDSSVPSFSLAMFDETGAPAFISHDPERGASPVEKAPSTAFDGIGPVNAESSDGENIGLGRLYAKMKCALWWDDIEQARTLYQKIVGDADPPSPILLQTLAELVGADPSLPADLAYEQARPLSVRALEAEPRLWQARIGLADRELDEDRMSDAGRLLEEGRALCPEEVSILRRQASTFIGYNWPVEAEETIQRIEQLMPTSCSTLDWKLSSARRRSRFDIARQIAEKSVQCDVFSESLLEELRRANDFKGAVAEADRLFALRPTSASAALETAKSTIAAGLGEKSIENFKTALALAPSEPGLVVGLSDALKMSGNDKEAASVIERGLNASFISKPVLLDARAALSEKPMLESFRVDGLQVIEQYKAESPQYDAAAVYVLDRAVYMVDEMGGIVMLVHSIAHLKTDEAVESHGELSIPSGARLLRARTVKADGQLLEPQEVSGKETLSMPDLAPGDFVEYEYVLFTYPNQLFPGGFDTDRFFFQDFETGFHRTEIIVVVPSDMTIETDPRGNCPEAREERSGDYRVVTWKTRNASPHPSEPLSPSAVEFLPSIRVTALASWENIFMRIIDQLADKDRAGYIIHAAVQDALKGVDAKDHRARRQALYRWVMKHIDPSSSNLFEESSHIIARKSGNRARAFSAMLKASGYPSRLALVMPGGEDETPNALPSIKQFYQLVAEVPGDGFVDLGSEFVPYGFLPAALRNRPLRYLNTGALSETDGGKLPTDAQTIVASITLSANGDAAGRIRETYTGGLAGEWREALEKNLETDYQRMFQSAYLSDAIPGAKLVQMDIQGLKDPEAPLIFEYDISVPNFAVQRDDRQLYVRLPFATNFSKQSGGLPVRTVPLVLSLHVKKTVKISLLVPSGLHVPADGSPNESITQKWGYAIRDTRVSENTTAVKFETMVDVDRVSCAKYEEFLSFAKQVDRISDASLRLSKQGKPF